MSSCGRFNSFSIPAAVLLSWRAAATSRLLGCGVIKRSCGLAPIWWGKIRDWCNAHWLICMPASCKASMKGENLPSGLHSSAGVSTYVLDAPMAEPLLP